MPDNLELMQSERKLRRISAILRYGSLTLALLLPGAIGYAWFLGPIATAPAPHAILQTPDISSVQWLISGVVALVAPILLSVALLIVSRCFTSFSEGVYFSLLNAKRLSGFGRWIVLSGCAGLMAPTIQGLVLTAHAAVGERVFLIELGSGPLLSLLIGGLIWALARLMEKASELAEENALII